MIKKSMKSTIFVLLLLGIFTGLAAAVDDIYLEEDDDLDDTRAFENDIITCPYGTSNIFHANIDAGSDIDYCKTACHTGDYFDIFIDREAYLSYVSARGETQSGALVTLTSYADPTTGTHYIYTSPLYIKLANDNLDPYTDYQFFVQRIDD